MGILLPGDKEKWKIANSMIDSIIGAGYVPVSTDDRTYKFQDKEGNYVSRDVINSIDNEYGKTYSGLKEDSNYPMKDRRIMRFVGLALKDRGLIQSPIVVKEDPGESFQATQMTNQQGDLNTPGGGGSSDSTNAVSEEIESLKTELAKSLLAQKQAFDIALNELQGENRMLQDDLLKLQDPFSDWTPEQLNVYSVLEGTGLNRIPLLPGEDPGTVRKTVTDKEWYTADKIPEVTYIDFLLGMGSGNDTFLTKEGILVTPSKDRATISGPTHTDYIIPKLKFDSLPMDALSPWNVFKFDGSYNKLTEDIIFEALNSGKMVLETNDKVIDLRNLSVEGLNNALRYLNLIYK